MASAIVGTLKVLLTAETGQYATGLDQASKKTQQFSGELTGFASQVSSVGKALGGMLTLGAITRAITSVTQYAGKITDLAAQTGLSTKAIQEMDHAARLTGASLENFTNAAFKLGTNIAGGSNSVQGAIERLGLSYDALRKMSPEEQFHTIATALGTVENAQERNKLAVELFGKVAKEILPAIAQGYDDLASSAAVAGEEQLKSLDAAGDALDGFFRNLKSVGVELAGGYLLAVNKATVAYQQWLHSILNTQEAHTTLAAHLEVVGLKSQVLPKVLNESTVAARNLPPALKPVEMSLAEVRAAEQSLTAQVQAKIEANKAAKKSQDEMTAAHQRFVDSVKTDFYTANYYVEFKAAVMEAGRELQELASTVPAIAQSFVPLKAAVQEGSQNFITFADTMRDTFTALPTVIMNAIQGGGSILAAAGSHIGTSLMSSFQQKFGPAIAAALPFGIGNAINALLPTLGALFGPIAEKIGGFFRRIFGGPSADELRGREAVAAFEAQLHSLLTQTQRNEAGNESWKMTVIAIRDAYLAAGLTEQQAMQAAEKLWASSRDGAAASQRAIEEIKRVLDGVTTATQVLDSALDSTFVDRSFTVVENRQINEDVYRREYDVDTEEGFAGGTMGRLGQWFGSFPSTGLATALHGVEAVITPQQAPAFAMDVLSASGATSALTDFSGVESRLASVERLLRGQPRHFAAAIQEAVAIGGRSR